VLEGMRDCILHPPRQHIPTRWVPKVLAELQDQILVIMEVQQLSGHRYKLLEAQVDQLERRARPAQQPEELKGSDQMATLMLEEVLEVTRTGLLLLLEDYQVQGVCLYTEGLLKDPLRPLQEHPPLDTGQEVLERVLELQLIGQVEMAPQD